MDANRFDAWTKALTGRLSRRVALGGGGAGLLGLAGRRRSSAQDAGPEASPAASPAPTAGRVDFLFVQTAASGSFVPKAEAAGLYELTLREGAGQTVYFSDRPARFVGTVPTARFLRAAGLGFATADPPNAALVVQTDDGEDTIVVELLNPSYDVPTGTVTYEARILAEYQGEGLASLAARQTDQVVPERFGPAALFIDSVSCLAQGVACSGGDQCCSSHCDQGTGTCQPLPSLGDDSCGQCDDDCGDSSDCCSGFDCVGPEGFKECYATCCEGGCGCAC